MTEPGSGGASSGAVRDEPAPHDYEVQSSDSVFTGKVVSLRTDSVSMPGGGVAQRDVVEHPGAVGVVALDAEGRVLVLEQFRHPVRRRLWELPAGILDEPGETALAAIQRELVEEAGFSARLWHTLVDAYTSPGGSDEAIRVYLARDLTPVDRPAGHDEEAELVPAWLTLNEAADRILAGEIENAMAVIGILAALRARDRGFAGLRPEDAPWAAKPEYV